MQETPMLSKFEEYQYVKDIGAKLSKHDKVSSCEDILMEKAGKFYFTRSVDKHNNVIRALESRHYTNYSVYKSFCVHVRKIVLNDNLWFE